MGVHATIDISPETTLEFDGQYENDLTLVVENQPILSDCLVPNDEYVCFKALEDGWFKIDFGNVVSELSLKMHAEEGALQPNGTKMKEPVVSMENATEAVWTMANLPLDTNVLNMTVMATKMPFVGRG